MSLPYANDRAKQLELLIIGAALASTPIIRSSIADRVSDEGLASLIRSGLPGLSKRLGLAGDSEPALMTAAISEYATIQRVRRVMRNSFKASLGPCGSDPKAWLSQIGDQS